MSERPECPKWIGWCAIAILCLGSLQFAGTLLKMPALRGLGAAYGFAPYTKVFSDVDGFETYAARFSLILHKPDGTTELREVTPQFYQQLKGPYNRRNVYGAALSYAPRLPDPLWQSVFCYGFNGPLREELKIGPEYSSISIQIETKTIGRDDHWTFTPPCLD
jgi:hypothetical protein|tara:strand:+ start:886 stop:1374 length:489 start_codon:yes stop_codon:yes gene_type:complete